MVEETLYPLSSVRLFDQEINPDISRGIINEGKHVSILTTSGGYLNRTHKVRMDEGKGGVLPMG
jgi:hypothetical protein